MKNTKPYVFDTLTHFVTENGGIDLGKPLGIEGYMSYVNSWANPNIKAINLLSGACPKYQRGDKSIIPCKWGVRDGKIKESAYEIIEGRETQREVGEDCYSEVNGILLKESKRISKTHPNQKFFYSPMIHPKRTRVEDLEKLLSEGGENVLGLKVHGIATASGPDDFNPELAEYISEIGVPLIIHTDYDSRESPSRILTSKDARIYLQKINNPKDWADFCLKYRIKASLQHGARNDKRVYEIVKNNPDQFVVGLGPVLDGQGPRMAEKTNNYVASVLENLGAEHIVFSTDYPHNEVGEDLTKQVESLSRDEQEKIFYKNAETFFGKQISK